MKPPDGWVLVPRVLTPEMLACAHNAGWHNGIEGLPEAEEEAGATLWEAMLSAAPASPTDTEIETGKKADGFIGATYRMLDRCDYRQVTDWVRAELIRGTHEAHIFDAVSAMVASCVIQVAAMRARSVIRDTARRMMGEAARILESDVQTVIQHKKADTVLHKGIHVVPPG